MTPYNHILELHAQGLNNSEIERTIGDVSRKTIITVIQLSEKFALSYPIDPPMTDLEIHRLLHPKVGKEDRLPSMDKIFFGLGLPGQSISKVWEQYKTDCSSAGSKPYSKAQFQNIVKESREKTNIPQYRSLMVFRYIPNAVAEEDKTYGLLAAEVVGSHYMTTALITDKKTRTWIHGIIRIINRFHGVPDQCCFSTHLPVSVAAETEDCLNYYGMKLLPENKKIETVLVGQMQDMIKEYRESDTTVSPFLYVNAKCMEFNSRGYLSSTGFTRDDAFKLESKILHKIPDKDYDLIEYTEVSPQYNHVQIDGMYYSVPFDYRHEKLVAYISDKLIEVHADGAILCVHERLMGSPGRYQTDPDHLPKESDIPWNEPSGRSIRSWADKIGPYTRKTMNFWLKRANYEAQAYKTCNTVLHLSAKHGPEALERACKAAWDDKQVSYRAITEILKNGV